MYTDEEITILTEIPYSLGTSAGALWKYLKQRIKSILFALTRSPRYLPEGGVEAVLTSLRQGLTELGISYRYNPRQGAVTNTVGVVSGPRTLAWALTQKRSGRIKTLIAGPNIVVAPTDEHNIIKNPLIDAVVIPSQWNKKWWCSFDQYFDSKGVVWPAGVADHGASRDPNGVCLVYAKNIDEKFFQEIIKTLWNHNLGVVVSRYGQFHRHEYFHLLKKTKFMIYLSESESQGIALAEAWMADVPTLVWNRGYFEYNGRRFEDETVGAPYLQPEAGLAFKDQNDFEFKLLEFLEKYNSFTPRQYALSHFTNSICARKYLNIIANAQSAEK